MSTMTDRPSSEPKWLEIGEIWQLTNLSAYPGRGWYLVIEDHDCAAAGHGLGIYAVKLAEAQDVTHVRQLDDDVKDFERWHEIQGGTVSKSTTLFID